MYIIVRPCDYIEASDGRLSPLDGEQRTRSPPKKSLNEKAIKGRFMLVLSYSRSLLIALIERQKEKKVSHTHLQHKHGPDECVPSSQVD